MICCSLIKPLPALAVSIRTVERVVKEIRGRIKRTAQNRFLKLHHQPGEAQLDFGEVEMFHDGYEERHFILVMSFPFSNFRLAQVLPAQNFECLAFGLQQIFAIIGHIPNTIRCDNMSTGHPSRRSCSGRVRHRSTGSSPQAHTEFQGLNGSLWFSAGIL